MQIIKRLGALWLGLVLSTALQAQEGHKPMRLIVPYPPGGSTDSMARHLAPLLGQHLNRPVVVDNRPGGATVVAGQALASAPADGSALAIFDPATVAINPSLFERLSYDPARFEPVALLARIPFAIMVSPGFPADDLGGFVVQARSRPLNFAIAGTGNAPHLAMERFLVRAGVKALAVPYRGGAPALQDLIGGQIPIYVNDIAGAMPYIQAGKVKVIAVMSRQRVPELPQVPTVAESGYPDFEAGSWFGAFAPAGTPARTTERLGAALRAALASPAVREWARSVTLELSASAPDELARMVEQDTASYGATVRELGLALR